jgi:tRNA-dihydrouridine synthase
MVGLSHVAMREALRHYMPAGARTIWPTEMLSSFKLPKQNLKSVSMLVKAENENDLVPQILGNEREPIEQSINIISGLGAVGVDVNMGCPVKKALKYNYGVSLMGDPDYAAQVVSFAVNAPKRLPVSVKFRAGIQKDEGVLEAFSQGIESAGASWVTLHPRLSEQKRRGVANWNQIALLKSKLKIPVVGNGDVETLDDFIKMKEETGCDMVMVGRALTVRPWLLWQLGEELGFREPPGYEGKEAPKDSFAEGRELGIHMLRLLEYHFKFFNETEALKKYLFYIKVMHPWLMFGHDLYRKSTMCKNKESLKNLIEDFFSRPQNVMQKSKGKY